jgi:RNA polymerase sigma-70 factor, ECF subfamily
MPEPERSSGISSEPSRVLVDEQDDEEIVLRIRGGERDLFELLVRRHASRMHRIARAIVRQEVEAEEVVQESWLRVIEHIAQFAGRGRFAGWVSRIVVHEAWARARRRRAMRSAIAAARGSELAFTDQRLDPERTASDNELGVLAETALGSLPERYRVILMLRRIEGLSTADVARSLGVSTLAVKSILHRAEDRLRRLLLSGPASRPDRGGERARTGRGGGSQRRGVDAAAPGSSVHAPWEV